MKKNNSAYWNKFYSKFYLNKETSFARFVLKRIKKNNRSHETQ